MIETGFSSQAQGRFSSRAPVAVIDIGSNSVRQVIYEGLTRAPAVLFNEKVLCGLGKGLVETKKLDEKAVACAIAAIRRFRALADQVGVSQTFVLATAAARDAKNGKAFVEEVEKRSGCPVEILSGDLEAMYSAYGVQSGFYDPDGIVGDLGGGSLELVAAIGDIKDTGETFPLGGLRIQDLSNSNIKKAREIAREHLAKCQVQWPGRRRDFYAVGGTWRSLAKLHIAQTDYPLNVAHHYTCEAKKFLKFCEKVADSPIDKIDKIDIISKNRRQLLPFGAVVLAQTLSKLDAERIHFSALGVREGYLYSRLSKEELEKDMLLEAAWDLAVLRARSPQHSQELALWTAQGFAAFSINETQDERRFRQAACYLADIGWRAHPDYRAAQSLGIISNAGFVGLNHPGRAYLSLANYHRYQGLGQKVKAPPIAALADDRIMYRARMLAALFRVAYLFTASMPGVLPQITFANEKDKVIITLPNALRELVGERPQLRINQLAREAGCEVALKIE